MLSLWTIQVGIYINASTNTKCYKSTKIIEMHKWIKFHILYILCKTQTDAKLYYTGI